MKNNQLVLNKIWFWVVVTAVLVASVLGVAQTILKKNSTENSEFVRMTIDKSKSKYSFERKWGEDYDKGLIMFIGYISKKDLSFSGATFDLINKPGKVGEQISDPEFVLEKYNAQYKLISYQALSAHDKIMFESTERFGSRELDYWVVSTTVAFEPEVLYWRIVSVEGREVWRANVHIEVLKTAWNGVPNKALIDQKSRQIVENKIESLKTSYEVLNKDEIVAGLVEIKSLISESVRSDFERETLIAQDKESMVKVVEEIEKRVLNL